MANQIIYSANIAPPSAAIEVSYNGGTSWQPLTFATVGSLQQAVLANVPAATYAIGQVGMGAVGYPASRVFNTAALTVLAAAAPAAAPTLASFSPASAAVGAAVTLTGTGFTGATAVNFNGLTASFTVISDTSINATVPSGATTGAISVTVGSSTATNASSFTVTAAIACNIVASGNSLVEGNFPGSDAGESAIGGKLYAWPNQLARETGWTAKNQGHSGFTFAQLSAYVDQGELDTLFTDTTKQQWYWLEEITNTADAGQAGTDFTAQQVYDQYKALVQKVRAKYPSVSLKVGVMTGYPRSNYPQAYNDKVDAVNVLLRAGYASFADVLADVRTSACLPDVTRMADKRISFDGTHLSAEGNTLVEKLVLKATRAGAGIVTLSASDYTMPAAIVAAAPALSENTSNNTITVSLAGNSYPVTEVFYRETGSNGIYYQVPASGVVQLPTVNKPFPYAAGDLYFFVRYAASRQASANALNTQPYAAIVAPAPVSQTSFSPPQAAALESWFGTGTNDYVLNGTAITQRTDKSGKGRHALVTAGTTAPIAVTSTGRVMSRFAGSSQMDALSAYPGVGNLPFTLIFEVVRSNTSGNAVLGCNTHLAYFSNGAYMQDYTGATNMVSSLAHNIGDRHVYMLVFDGTSEKLYADNVDVSTGSGGFAQTVQGNTLNIGGSPSFGSKYLNGDLGTIATYSVALSAADRAAWFTAIG